MEYFANPSLSVVVAKCRFLGFVVQDSAYVFSIYLNPDVDDRIFYCMLTSMAAVQAEDVRGPLSCMRVICMAIIMSGWVLLPQIVIVLQPWALQLCLVAITPLCRQSFLCLMLFQICGVNRHRLCGAEG